MFADEVTLRLPKSLCGFVPKKAQNRSARDLVKPGPRTWLRRVGSGVHLEFHPL
jgi:hypothetical protein